jgi:hypothetical protein
MESMTQVAFATQVIQTSPAEWEVRVEPSWDCVGHISRTRAGFEVIQILPPYLMTQVGDLGEALRCIRATLDAGDDSIAAVYADPREHGVPH